MAKFLGFGVIEIGYVFFSRFVMSSVASLEEEEDEEEEEGLEEEEELLVFVMLASSAFSAALRTLPVCLEMSSEDVSEEEELPMTVGSRWSSSMASLST